MRKRKGKTKMTKKEGAYFSILHLHDISHVITLTSYMRYPVLLSDHITTIDIPCIKTWDF